MTSASGQAVLCAQLQPPLPAPSIHCQFSPQRRITELELTERMHVAPKGHCSFQQANPVWPQVDLQGCRQPSPHTLWSSLHKPSSQLAPASPAQHPRGSAALSVGASEEVEPCTEKERGHWDPPALTPPIANPALCQVPLLPLSSCRISQPWHFHRHQSKLWRRTHPEKILSGKKGNSEPARGFARPMANGIQPFASTDILFKRTVI